MIPILFNTLRSPKTALLIVALALCGYTYSLKYRLDKARTGLSAYKESQLLLEKALGDKISELEMQQQQVIRYQGALRSVRASDKALQASSLNTEGLIDSLAEKPSPQQTKLINTYLGCEYGFSTSKCPKEYISTVTQPK